MTTITPLPVQRITITIVGWYSDGVRVVLNTTQSRDNDKGNRLRGSLCNPR